MLTYISKPPSLYNNNNNDKIEWRTSIATTTITTAWFAPAAATIFVDSTKATQNMNIHTTEHTLTHLHIYVVYRHTYSYKILYKNGCTRWNECAEHFHITFTKKEKKKNINQTTANFMCNHTMLFGVQYKTPNKYYIKLGICWVQFHSKYI